jgi:F-type H+-transporting ATPase subunit epsilon
MADGFALEVVTPDRPLIEETAEALVLRTTEGDMTVLDGHTSLVAAVTPGIVRIEVVDAEPVRLAVHGGFLQVDTGPEEESEGSSGLTTRVTLLAGVAELASEIDVERARRAKEAAEVRLGEARPERVEEENRAETVEETEAAAALARAELRLEAAGESPS